MKAITLWQPWASFMAFDLKRIETRSWSTAYRGPLAIHAAARQHTEDAAVWHAMLKKHGLANKAFSERRLLKYEQLPFGAVVATCTLADCVSTNDLSSWNISRMERDMGNYAYNRFGWIVQDVQLLETPVFCRGYQLLWDWNA